MRKLILLLLLACFIKQGYAQPGWFAQPIPLSSISDIQFLNPQLGFACGDYGKYTSTTDGGNTWILRSIGDSTISLRAVNFIDANSGWMAGSMDNGFPMMYVREFLYYTTNGGVNWNLRYQFDGYTSPSDIYMLSKDSIIIASSGFSNFSSEGSLKYSFNGGTSFNQAIVSSGPQYYNLQFINKQTGFVVSCYDSDTGPYFNWLFKTSNSGANWNAIYKDSVQPPRLISSFFVNENTGFLSASNGRFGSTTNAGANWTFTMPGFTINTFYFFDANIGYAGSSGLKRTTNGGVTWTDMNNSVLGGIGKIIFVNNLTGWATGYSSNGARLMKTVTGGITSVNPIGNTIPDNFSLSQNYPNPFNPTTKINYVLPITNFVSLKVYDALGNEVESLVNEKQNAGSYSVDFNAASLPSGIYFYKLVTEKFSETKKMVLVK